MRGLAASSAPSRRARSASLASQISSQRRYPVQAYITTSTSASAPRKPAASLLHRSSSSDCGAEPASLDPAARNLLTRYVVNAARHPSRRAIKTANAHCKALLDAAGGPECLAAAGFVADDATLRVPDAALEQLLALVVDVPAPLAHRGVYAVVVAAAQHDHGGPVRRALQLADHLLDLRVRPRGVIDAGNLGRFLVVCGPGVVFLVFEGGRVAGGGHDPSLVVNLDVIDAERTAEVVPLPPLLPREGCGDSGGGIWVSLGDWRAASREIEGGASNGGGGNGTGLGSYLSTAGRETCRIPWATLAARSRRRPRL